MGFFELAGPLRYSFFQQLILVPLFLFCLQPLGDVSGNTHQLYWPSGPITMKLSSDFRSMNGGVRPNRTISYGVVRSSLNRGAHRLFHFIEVIGVNRLQEVFVGKILVLRPAENSTASRRRGQDICRQIKLPRSQAARFKRCLKATLLFIERLDATSSFPLPAPTS